MVSYRDCQLCGEFRFDGNTSFSSRGRWLTASVTSFFEGNSVVLHLLICKVCSLLESFPRKHNGCLGELQLGAVSLPVTDFL